jgi:hypothetical protein
MDLKRIIQEEVNDFGWIENIPNTDLYRYFEVYVCGDTQYDDDDDYYAGPGDEGLGVIEWAIDNDIMDRDDEYAIPEYVTEKTKKEFCLAWGNYNDKEVCKEFLNTHWLTDEPVNESNDFDWMGGVVIKPRTIKETVEKAEVGDIIYFDSFSHHHERSKGWSDKVTATVIMKGPLTTIHPLNSVNTESLLIHIDDEDYVGFDIGWFNKFEEPGKTVCQDGQCMFLIPDTTDYVKGEIALVKSRINESSDFTWVKDVTPRVFDLLYIATKDNPRINVHFSDGGDFTHINDHNGMNYFDGYDIGSYLEMDPEEVYDINKEDLMRYIMEYHISGGGWNGVVDPDNLKGNPLYVYNEDYRDYVDLYELVKTL